MAAQRASPETRIVPNLKMLCGKKVCIAKTPPMSKNRNNQSSLSICFGISDRKNQHIPYDRNPTNGKTVGMVE